ncbi:MAG: hypothetical protein JSS12_11130 [Verrucomicrobia bacterium]|nr:hypothetical protein [Verrucomicrobiota bacterium]
MRYVLSLLCLLMSGLAAGQSVSSQPQQSSKENFAMPGENEPPLDQDVVDQPDCNPPAEQYPKSLDQKGQEAR